jgi:hypothetical protein
MTARKDRVVYVRFDAEQHDWLKARASAAQRSVSGEVRFLVDASRRNETSTSQEKAA